MTPRVVITGAGLVSPLGSTVHELHEALCEARGVFRPPTLFSADECAGHRVAEVLGFDARSALGERNLRPLDRTAQLAAVAVDRALLDSGWTPERRQAEEIGLVLGTMFGSLRTIGEFDRRSLREGPQYVSPIDFANTVINAAAGQVAIMHQLRGVNATVASGAASGLQAIVHAARLIQSGRAAALVAGGAEELCFEACLGFLRAGSLHGPAAGEADWPRPFDAGRSGWMLGEGAAFVVLEDERAAAARGARVMAAIAGFGAAFDSRGDMATVAGPNALPHAIGAAMARVDAGAEALCAVSASASGSLVVDAREALALAEALGADAPRLPVTAIKSMAGEGLGVSGALQVIALVESLRTRRLPGIAGFERTDIPCGLRLMPPGGHPIQGGLGLVTSVAPEGHCCALLLSVPDVQ